MISRDMQKKNRAKTKYRNKLNAAPDLRLYQQHLNLILKTYVI